MKEFMGVKYKHESGTQWAVVWPSGMRGTINAVDEEALLDTLRQLLANL